MMYLNCKGNLIDLTKPKVMGILNVTPDSFYDGGKFRSDATILKHVNKMLSEGAYFIDIGAYSSRPNASHISEKEEFDRLIPAIEIVLKEFPDVLLSVDTFRSEIARESILSGASLINDISGGEMDQNMFETIAQLNVPYILMHMVGTPQNMVKNVNYEDLVKDIIKYFSRKIYTLRQLGVNDLLIDPGFGFSKTLDQNYELLQKMDLLQTFNVPILAGLSRKSMLYKLLDTTPEKALNATTAANLFALIKGASILRVHDVKEAHETIAIFQKINNAT